MIIPAEEAIKKIMPIVKVKKVAVDKLLIGKPLMRKDLLNRMPKEDRFAVFYDNRFVEVACKVDESGILARPEFVYN